MEIHVNESHIKEGDKLSCAFCPVALAAREQHGIEEEDITVLEKRMWARDRLGRMRQYNFPREAIDWIRVFDYGTQEQREAIRPIKFRAVRQ